MPIDLTLYALDTITDSREFEKLCNDLLFREGFKNLKPHGGMHDRGIDALIHVHETNSRIICQYSTQKTFDSKIKGTLQKLKENGEQCDELHYVTNREVPYSTARDLISFADAKYGTKLEIYDREWMRVRLDNDSSDLRKKYLGLAGEIEYSVDYEGYWTVDDDGKQAYVVRIFWIDESGVQALQTTITATPSDNLAARFNQLVSKGAFNFPSFLLLQMIASLCQFHFNTQVIDEEPVKSKVVVQDSSEGSRGLSVDLETFRLVDMPKNLTVVYLLNYVPGVCDALSEEIDKEMTVKERALYALWAKEAGVDPSQLGGGRIIRASDLLLKESTLLWNEDEVDPGNRTGS